MIKLDKRSLSRSRVKEEKVASGILPLNGCFKDWDRFTDALKIIKEIVDSCSQQLEDETIPPVKELRIVKKARSGIKLLEGFARKDKLRFTFSFDEGAKKGV